MALQLSHQLINECGGLEQLSAMSVTELRGLEGICYQGRKILRSGI